MAPDESPPRQDAAPVEENPPVPSWDGTTCADLEDASLYLRRPFTEHALKWKVQVSFPTLRGDQKYTKEKPAEAALLVPYIDARLVIERLNALVPHLWYATFAPADAQHFERCFLTIRHPAGERHDITRTDVGYAADPKARQSDALKRAAVHFGIGVSLYALPKQQLQVGGVKNKADGKLRLNRAFSPIIDAGTESYLRSIYGSWLEDARNTYGPPLDHGDVQGSAGDVEEAVPEPESEPEHPPLQGEGVDELVANIRLAAKGQVPPAGLEAQIEAARRHPDTTQLEALLASLTTKGDTDATD